MFRRPNARLSLAALFFCLCLVASFALAAPQPADALGHCFICQIDYCDFSNFGWTECDAVFIEWCETSGNFCTP